ncbi:hypothetical protein J595_02411 [Acinetobacter sp. 1592897]|nr:hypothetical protein ACINWC487_2036 [Acinetobacter nosocomialis]EXB12097.1 hypothetical protein J514_1980 [Acinetobacter sp. 1396970]EXF01688.1 hypothetical protein J594_0033 [Acinetobacter sp. 259052]EXH13942.1 hypothetical protein J627_1817 [Acinetobacter sp. 1245593]EXH74769.1 hypothetical protein J633_3221 [Acinetobacter sp. 216872]EXI10865.1 hypothetical protein J604_2836 [Acinetobacter sp. 694762]EXR28566.1 hypothetical protein J694_2280 [Acinetobacter sp. 1281984]EXS48392.1 hypothe
MFYFDKLIIYLLLIYVLNNSKAMQLTAQATLIVAYTN